MARRAEIYLFDVLAGELDEDENGYRFRYAPAYLAGAQAIPLSQTLPLRPEPYLDRQLFPFFDGLIPEGWLLAIAEKTWKLDPRDRMGLLLACCHDCIGAVSVRQIGAEGQP
jgi:serine/threonine-protein kinase HipA